MFEKLKASYADTKQKLATKMFAKELQLSYQKGLTKQSSLAQQKSEKQSEQIKRLTLGKPVIAFHSADRNPIVGFVVDVKSNVFFIDDRVSKETVTIIKKPFDFNVDLLHHILRIDPKYRYYIVTGDSKIPEKAVEEFLSYPDLLEKLRENEFFKDVQDRKERLTRSREKIFGRLFRKNTKVKFI